MASDITVATKEVPLFVKKKHELSSTLKKLGHLSDDALTVLEEGLASEDQKVRRECAKAILDYQKDYAKQINDDMMQRQIAEIKLNGGATKNLTTEEKARQPVIDFNNIIDV